MNRIAGKTLGGGLGGLFLLTGVAMAQVAAPSLLTGSVHIGDPEDVPRPAMMSLNPAVDSWHGTL